ncbi:hypothetical protein N9682_05600 [Candidatus Pelagibacter sp.]|nr:hypothetical protein [Candidatus Pelagibacter sp.]
MHKDYNFYIQDFDSVNEKDYRKRITNSHIFHSLDWMQVIKESLGIKYKIATLKKSGKIVASISFGGYHNLIKGPCALPLQFTSYYGSIISDNDFIRKQMLEQFFYYCKVNKLYTQIPEINLINGHQSFSGYSIYKTNINMKLPVETQIIERANKRMRTDIKNAINSDLVCKTGGIELLDKFYLLYLQNMKELGTPPLPKIFFKKIIKFFPNLAKIILVQHHNRVCSGMFVLKVSEKELLALAISTPRLYKTGRSTHLIYLQAAKEAQKLGCSVMNFGRSIDGGGPALFKQRYGLEVIPLLMYSPYKNWTVTNPENSILKYIVAVWKKMPIPITKIGGLILAKHVI